jgi:hypothetical protein
MTDAFAIMHTWPELRNAEYEVLQRILGAANNAGYLAAVIDNAGNVLWASPELRLAEGKQLPAGAVKFVLSLHFDSPKLHDFYSYYALWQPIEFYYDFGYQASIDKLTTHNDLMSCDSDLADAHALNLFSGLGRRPLLPLPRLFHTLPEPFLEPRIEENAKLFYIGINWERVGKPKGRYHDMLIGLDAKGLTSIYGPERLFGVAPWEGFKTYQGELPFDGHSVKRAINRAGICLALSSTAHRQTGIMSNRLFEGFAGGAAVIATPNALIDKHFRDVVYLVDDSRGDEILGQMILETVREIRSNRDEAMRRVREGQRILREHCSLEASIGSLFSNHALRVDFFENQFLAPCEVTVILVDEFGDPALLNLRIADYVAQRKCSVHLHIICDDRVAARLEREAVQAEGAIRSLTIHGLSFEPARKHFDAIRSPSVRSGPTVGTILAQVSTPFFAIASVDEILFSDHFASLARALNDAPKSQFACSGALVQSADTTGVKRTVDGPRLTDMVPLLMVDGPRKCARFLFRSDLLSEDLDSLMSMLDGEEIRYFQLAAVLAASPAQTNYSTYVIDETVRLTRRAPAEPATIQQQYVRDRFARDPRWIERISGNVNMPEFVFAYAPGTPVRWGDYKAPVRGREPIVLDRMLATSIGGEGLAYLGEGFAKPEEKHVWISGERGIIDFSLPPLKSEGLLDYKIVIFGYGRRSQKSGREQHCTFALNGAVIAYSTIPDSPKEIQISIPYHLLKVTTAFRLEIIPDHSEPAESPPNGPIDPRHLSVAMFSIGVMSPDGQAMPTLNFGEIYGCGSGQHGAAALSRNFYEPEPGLTWLAGLSADIRFKLAGKIENPALYLRIRARTSSTGREQSASLVVNNKYLGAYDLLDGESTIIICLDETLTLKTVHLSVRIDHSEVTIDNNYNIIDGRLLGLAMLEIGVVDSTSAKESDYVFDHPEASGPKRSIQSGSAHDRHNG